MQLEARGQGGLLPLLREARGRELAGRFVVGEPFAAGGQALLFLATDRETGAEVLIKQAFFDYRRPILHGRREAAGRREALRVEHRVLTDGGSEYLPKTLAFLRAPALVPAAEDFLVLREETYLVLERIRGVTLEQAALTVWPSSTMAQREGWARRVAGEYIRFWEGLRGRGYFYCDTNPKNILIEEGTGRVRVVDAACVVPAGERVVLSEAAPAFLTPRLWQAATQGEEVPGDASTMLPVLAKVLIFALTRVEQANGQLPSLAEPGLEACSEGCRDALRTMLLLEHEPARVRGALSLLRSWAS